MANGNSTALIDSGFDAFTNLYDVELAWPTGVGTAIGQSILNVRALDFSPPELLRGQYEVKYKAISLPRLNAEITGKREFKLKFRVDASYNLHTNLLQWKHFWTDPSGEGNLEFQTTAPAGDNTLGYGTLVVRAYSALADSNGVSDPGNTTTQVAEKWTFYDVICLEAGKPSFSREGSKELTVEASFIFGRCIEPGQSTQSLSAVSIPVVGS